MRAASPDARVVAMIKFTTIPLNEKVYGDEEVICQKAALEYCREHGILKNQAVELGWRVVTSARSKDSKHTSEFLTGFKGAIEIQYFNPDGSHRVFKRYRRLNPDAAERDGKFYQPGGTSVQMYMPPITHKTLTMAEVLRDPSIPLFVAEGETRTVLLTKRGIPCFGQGGIASFGKDGMLCADLLRVNWQGRLAYVIVDSDVGYRPDLQRLVLGETKLLCEQGASDVRLIVTPDLGDGKTGADDFIRERGFAEFKKLINSAKSYRHPDFAAWGVGGKPVDLVLNPISSDWLEKEPAPIEWTWQGYLPRRSVGLLIAEGGIGKTYLAQRLVQSVAGGTAYLGRVTRRGKAVHIAFEEVPDELRRRQYAIFQNESADIPKGKLKLFVSALEQNLYLKSTVGQELNLAVMDGSNVVQGRALDVLIYQLRALGNVELVVIDPLSRAHSIDSESQAWGTVIINACERIALEVGCTVLLTHHTGKGKDKKDGKSYVGRGASALEDASRVVLWLTEPTDDEKKRMAVPDHWISERRLLRLSNTKLSYGPRNQPVWLFRDEDGVLIPFAPSEKASATFKGQLDELYKFAQGTKQETFSRDLIKRNRKEIFDQKISERAVKSLLDQGMQYGSIVESIEEVGGAKRLRFSEGYQPGESK